MGALFKSTGLRQALLLYGAELTVLAVGVLINSCNTRALGPESYGLYTFAFAIASYVGLFSNFGVYSSGSRILASQAADVRAQRETTGGLIVVTVLLALLAGLLLFAVSFFTRPWFRSAAGPVLRLYCFLFGLIGLQTLVEAVCRGTNRIRALSLQKAGGRILQLLLIVFFLRLRTYGLELALLFSLVSLHLASAAVLISCRPLFSNLPASLRAIWADVRTFGSKTYLGSITSTASYRTDSLILSYYAGTTAVGYYNLGGLLTFPMETFSNALSTTLFRGFYGQKKIPRAVLWLNSGWLCLCVAGLCLLGGVLVRLLFGVEYSAVIPLVPVLAATAFFGGSTRPFNLFMGAKGKGAYLRNTAFTLTAANLVLNFYLIPRFGALGAAYASFLALAVNYLLHLFYYRKTVRETEDAVHG